MKLYLLKRVLKERGMRSFQHSAIYWSIVMVVFIVGISSIVWAEEKQAKGLEVVSETVSAAANKVGALLTLNLEVTMAEDKDKYKYKDNYTINAIGEKVPKATSTKTGDALHNERPL